MGLTSLESLLIHFHFQCVQIAQQLERLSIRKEEYFLLKALILSNCEKTLDNPNALSKFRESILTSFNECEYLLR